MLGLMVMWCFDIVKNLQKITFFFLQTINGAL